MVWGSTPTSLGGLDEHVLSIILALGGSLGELLRASPGFLRFVADHPSAWALEVRNGVTGTPAGTFFAFLRRRSSPRLFGEELSLRLAAWAERSSKARAPAISSCLRSEIADVLLQASLQRLFYTSAGAAAAPIRAVGRDALDVCSQSGERGGAEADAGGAAALLVSRLDGSVRSIARDYLAAVVAGVRGSEGSTLATRFANAQFHLKQTPRGDDGCHLRHLSDLESSLMRAASVVPADTLLCMAEVKSLRSVLAEEYGVHMGFGYVLHHALGLFEAFPVYPGDQVVEHLYVGCDGCNARPLKGARYICQACDSHNLCAGCYAASGTREPAEPGGHVFARRAVPQGIQVPLWQDPSRGSGCTAAPRELTPAGYIGMLDEADLVQMMRNASSVANDAIKLRVDTLFGAHLRSWMEEEGSCNPTPEYISKIARGLRDGSLDRQFLPPGAQSRLFHEALALGYTLYALEAAFRSSGTPL